MLSRGIFSRCGTLGKKFSTLVIAEPTTGAKVPLPTLSAIHAAQQLKKDITVVVLGDNATESANAVAKFDGVKEVINVSGSKMNTPVAEVATKVLADIVGKKNPTHIVGAVSSFTRDVIPRLGAKLDVQPIADVTAIVSEDTFERPIYAGNAIAKVQSLDKVKVIYVRDTAFAPTPAVGSAAASVTTVEATTDGSKAVFLKEESVVSDKPQLGSSKAVVSGGRGLKNGENFNNVLEPLRAKLNAAMGATRGAVDAGYVPNDMQVGQTGKVVAPDLYFAVGISGAIQHVAGMKDSKTIVAINTDPDALIFQVADYGLVQDLFTAVPELTSKLEQQK